MITENIKGTRNIRLHEDYTIKTFLGEITIKKGFVCNLASLPRIVWVFAAPTDPGIREAALIHDWFYRNTDVRLFQIYSDHLSATTCGVTRETADEIFLEELEDEGIPKWKRYPMFWAVRLVGGGPPQALVSVFSKIPLLKRWKTSWVD